MTTDSFDTSQAKTPAVTTGTQPTATPAAHGFNSNTGYSNGNVGYSQRIDTLVQAYSQVVTPMSQQVACYTPIMQQGSSCQFGSAAGLQSSVSQSSGHPGLALSPTSSGYFFGNSSQVYPSPPYLPSLMVTPSAPHSSISGSGLPTDLVSSPIVAHSSYVASTPVAFMA
ncbi:hypothetical protein V6N12_036048 [Hibiscus sabdariffa]|uniref:Uncharacterized protein n=1 Tax=Hibiscus sabdariffa TaxID=183260 RepID=A0ABR2ER89_9ROSI